MCRRISSNATGSFTRLSGRVSQVPASDAATLLTNSGKETSSRGWVWAWAVPEAEAQTRTTSRTENCSRLIGFLLGVGIAIHPLRDCQK
jgi:hypothetical protein